MQFITAHRFTTFKLASGYGFEALLACQFGCYIQIAEPFGRSSRALDAVGIGDAAAEHLIATTEAQQATAAPKMRLDVDIPTLSAELRQIGACRFGARQQHQIGIARQRPTGLDNHQIDIGLGAQRIEIVEIGDPREARHGNANGARAAQRKPCAGAVEADRILRR